MTWWKRLLSFLRGRSSADASLRTFELDERMFASIQDLARRERRDPDEVAASLLVDALRDHQQADAAAERWKALTPRERQIVALICLNYTTGQIAARLVISPETVKSHVRNALAKFNAANRQELRRVLVHWDFSNWEDDRPG